MTYLPARGAGQIVVDPAGYAYIAGVYYDSRYTCTWTLGPQSTNPLSFVTKLQPSGDGVVWTVCAPALSAAVALDRAGSVYFAASDNASSILAKLSPIDGNAVYSTPIPGVVSSIAVDQAGHAYVTGAAGPSLPTTPGAYRSASLCPSTNSTCTDTYVVKLSVIGTIEYATYGNVTGGGNGIAVDSQGQVWITGTTSPSAGGRTDSFVMKLDSAGGQRLSFTVFSGGADHIGPLNAAGLGIAVDSKDAAYAVGITQAEIPTTPGTIQPNHEFGLYIGYIVKFDSVGHTVYATYIGGELAYPHSVAVDGAGNAYFALGTQENLGHCVQLVLSKLTVLNADASQILASGDLKAEFPAVALDGKGGLYVAGTTRTTAFLTTPNAYVTEYPGGSNAAFAGRVDFSKTGPRLNCVVNAATLFEGRNHFGTDGSIAPGEIVTVLGSGLTPGPDVSVTLDGKPAPILYADTGQINTVVPFHVGSGNPLVVLAVNHGTEIIGGLNVPVAPASPGLFSLNGQLAALNEDGSINSMDNPATPGSVVSLFMTGAGAYNMEIGDGDLGPLVPPFPIPLLGVSALIWPPSASPTAQGQQVPVLFVGQAPGLLAGVVQLNLRIPESMPTGRAGITVYVGDYPASAGFGAISAIEIR